jgi:hypothetical protein
MNLDPTECEILRLDAAACWSEVDDAEEGEEQTTGGEGPTASVALWEAVTLYGGCRDAAAAVLAVRLLALGIL